MAIRFDDRIKTNVAGDVLITGEQIAVSTDNRILEVGTSITLDFTIGTEDVNFSLTTNNVTTLDTIPDVIGKTQNDIYRLTTNIIRPIIDKINNIKTDINIDTTKKFFGDKLIVSSTDLNNIITNISTDINNPIKFPLITLLSAPIKLNLNDGIAYSTIDIEFPYGTNTIIPKNTLVYITTNSTFTNNIIKYNDVSYNVIAMSQNIQILSMPVSADSIHNNFETRIANIESLLALGQ